jgi:hypothetical protein
VRSFMTSFPKIARLKHTLFERRCWRLKASQAQVCLFSSRPWLRDGCEPCCIFRSQWENTMGRTRHTGFNGSAFQTSRMCPLCGYDGVHIPLKEAAVDLVYSRQVFEHVRHPESLIGELHRVLKPGGLFVGSTSQLEPFYSRQPAERRNAFKLLFAGQFCFFARRTASVM